MRKVSDQGERCVCESGKAAAHCCEPLLAGAQQAATAVALMRSRYAAFVLCDSDYLLRSWHPRTRPSKLDFNPEQRWLGLKIKHHLQGQAGDVTGQVAFVARYKLGSRGFALRELSSFECVDGRWLYVDGERN